MKGLKTVGAVKSIILSGDTKMENLVGRPETIHPVEKQLQGNGNQISFDVPAKGFMVLRF